MTTNTLPHTPASNLVVGKFRDVHPMMYVVAALFVVYFAISPLTAWLS